jgi:isopropylmalate/homocitrate/citramalate synthase
MPVIHFLDVTNRDGVQTARTGLSKFGKTMVNFYLSKLGVAQSEAGSRSCSTAVTAARAAGARTVGVNAEDGSRTGDGFLLEFAAAAREAGADRVRYCDTSGTRSPTSLASTPTAR